MQDPEFLSGSQHTAVVKLAVNPASLSCSIELYLSVDGVTKAVTSGEVNFLSTGVQQSILIPITSPLVQAAYGVYLVILVNDQVFGIYKAAENAVIGAADIRLVSLAATQEIHLGEPITIYIEAENFGTIGGVRTFDVGVVAGIVGIQIISLAVTPQVILGESVFIDIGVQNFGDTAGSKTFDVYVN